MAWAALEENWAVSSAPSGMSIMCMSLSMLLGVWNKCFNTVRTFAWKFMAFILTSRKYFSCVTYSTYYWETYCFLNWMSYLNLLVQSKIANSVLTINNSYRLNCSNLLLLGASLNNFWENVQFFNGTLFKNFYLYR